MKKKEITNYDRSRDKDKDGSSLQVVAAVGSETLDQRKG